MRLHPPIRFHPMAALALIIVTPLAGQSLASAPAQENPPKESSKKQEKARLEEVTRVNTEKAAQSAAKEKSKASTEEKKKKVPELSGGSEVTEFHPAAAEESAPGGKPGTAKTKPRAKDIHGTVYGAGSARSTRAAGGGEVGATTKSGKTSVYVQSEKSRAADPTPH